MLAIQTLGPVEPPNPKLPVTFEREMRTSEILNRAGTDRNLTATSLRCLAYLLSEAETTGATGVKFTMQTLSDILNTNKATIHEGVKRLVMNGYLIRSGASTYKIPTHDKVVTISSASVSAGDDVATH